MSENRGGGFSTHTVHAAILNVHDDDKSVLSPSECMRIYQFFVTT